MDFITKLPKSKDPVIRITYDAIMVIVDQFTKYLIMVPFKETHTAEQLGCYDQGEAAGYLYPRRFPTSGQDRQVRVTTCRDHMIYDHMICVTRGHVTFEPGEPTGGMAQRARFRAF